MFHFYNVLIAVNMQRYAIKRANEYFYLGWNGSTFHQSRTHCAA